MPSKDELHQLYAAASRSARTSTLTSEILDRSAVLHSEFLHCYHRHSDEQTQRLARGAAIIQLAVEWIQDNEYNTNRDAFFVELAELVKDMPYMPGNYRILKSKIVAVLNGAPITDVVFLPRVGNNNSLRFDDAELMAWLLQMRSMPQNYTNAHIIRKLQFLCALSAKPTPSASWFNLELAKAHTKFLTSGRYGKNGRRGVTQRGYVPVENAMFAGDCWQADGTRINFISHKGKEGKEEFLYIVAIRDVYSGDILGWHLDTKEDRWAYISALKMATNIAGYLPWELVCDRFPGHNTEEWKVVQSRLEREGVKVTTTSTATGKARLERLFGTLQSVFMQESVYYYGEGVQSRRDYAHRSEEYLNATYKKARREGWNFDDAWREANRVIAAYRDTKLSYYSRKHRDVDFSPRQLHLDSEKPNGIKLEIWSFVELFGLEKRVKMRAQGLLKTDIQRVEYMFVVDEYTTIAHYKEVAICYDMDNLNQVYLFEPSGATNRKYLGTATEQRAVQLYGPTADKKELGKAKKRLEDLKKRREEEFAELTAAGEVSILLGSYSNKDDTASAETAWLIERANEWKDTGKPRITIDKDDDAPLDFDVRQMY